MSKGLCAGRLSRGGTAWGMLMAAIILGVFAPAADGKELLFTLLHTNDEHSALLPYPLVDYHPEEPGPTTGGFARLGRMVRDIRAEKETTGEPVVLVSAADIFGGAPFAWLIPDGEAPELTVMQQIGYDAITIGNHEFDYGPGGLASYYKAAGYPEAAATTALVASNLRIPEDHPLEECGIVDTHVIELENGLRLGVFGLLGENAIRLIKYFEPMGLAGLVEASEAAVAKLRNSGVDVIIGLSHAGLDEDRALASTVAGIDLLVTGHYHTTPMYEPMQIGGTILVHAGSYLRYLGALELAYHPETGALRIRNAESGRPFLTPIDESVEEDPAIAATIAGYAGKLGAKFSELTGGKVARIDEAILHTTFPLASSPPLRESVLGNFVADAMRVAAEAATGERADFAIQANGVIRGDVPAGTTPQSRNTVNLYDLASAIGLGTGEDDVPGYPLASIYLTGNDLYRMFELSLFLAEGFADIFFLQISGGRVTYDPGRVVLFRVPFTGWPVPTLRGVRSIERFTGQGTQNASAGEFQRIPRGDDTLYHVVCDAYILSFFPRVADLLPIYQVVPKDRHGNPIEFRESIMRENGMEQKVWQAVTAYAGTLPRGNAGIPEVPAHYAETGARIVRHAGFPVLFWLVPLLLLLFSAPLALWRRRARRKRLRNNSAPLHAGPDKQTQPLAK